MTVPTAIYFGAGRGSRRRVSKELARLKEINDEMAPARAKYNHLMEVWAKTPDPAVKQRLALAIEEEFGPIRHMLAPNHIPVRLLACLSCGKPTAECQCPEQGWKDAL
jgi:hypothetical protein